MKATLRYLAFIVVTILVALFGIRIAIYELGWILFVSLAFFLIAISVVFVAVF